MTSPIQPFLPLVFVGKFAPELIEQVEAGDIIPQELWIGGEITKRLNLENAHIFRGIKATAEDIKKVIIEDLNLPTEEPKK